MNPSTAYDITRLVTRVLNVTPNGIDRIDFALARHFLAKSEAAGMMATGLGPRVLPGEKARAAVEAIGAHWGEEAEPENDPGYLRVRAELPGTAPPPAGRAAPRIAQGRQQGDCDARAAFLHFVPCYSQVCSARYALVCVGESSRRFGDANSQPA